ncbi:DUF488 domain-containing protein [Sphingobacterium sp. DR205]|uniref:DUF488 domain-containing protein n=1 Tax=Sphingobacterium sp. DR205 TaxID=2713573 RepID=UPI0013E4E1A3|nr:DUF488 domain-containing protein [Sphingobacterium sp. DR205]QIH34114.1 DUF488 domain-containing protein [Sphingobacterium sp. DR205]
MQNLPLYTIGHGNRKAEDFLRILKLFSIEYLIDVRSQPYSKFNPQFNQNELRFLLENNNIKYVFMGDSIGGRPKDFSCYDEEGKVDYEIVKTKDFFIEGIKRLKTAYNKKIKVVIMCSESKPCECHRSKLIGRVLKEENISLKHIDERGKLKDQSIVISELNKGLGEFDLFGNSINTTSRKAYL